MNERKPCPHCSGTNLYLNKKGISGGGYAANYLPGLGGLMTCAKLYPVICGDCGLVRFFADQDARAKLPTSDKWMKI